MYFVAVRLVSTQKTNSAELKTKSEEGFFSELCFYLEFN